MDGIQALEAVATDIANNTQLFDITIDGITYSIDPASIDIKADMKCEVGFYYTDGLCCTYNSIVFLQ